MNSSKLHGFHHEQKKLHESTIKMNVNVPKSIHKKMKQKALDQDTTVTKLVVKLLHDYTK